MNLTCYLLILRSNSPSREFGPNRPKDLLASANQISVAVHLTDALIEISVNRISHDEPEQDGKKQRDVTFYLCIVSHHCATPSMTVAQKKYFEFHDAEKYGRHRCAFATAAARRLLAASRSAAFHRTAIVHPVQTRQA
jgi:hypothetical protein